MGKSESRGQEGEKMRRWEGGKIKQNAEGGMWNQKIVGLGFGIADFGLS